MTNLINTSNFRTPELENIERRRIFSNNDLMTDVLDSFTSHGSCIQNPYLDESGMDTVVPEEYYGEEYLKWYLKGADSTSKEGLSVDSSEYEDSDKVRDCHVTDGKILIALGTVMVARGISILEALEGGASINSEIVERLAADGFDRETALRIVSSKDTSNWLRQLNRD